MNIRRSRPKKKDSSTAVAVIQALFLVLMFWVTWKWNPLSMESRISEVEERLEND